MYSDRYAADTPIASAGAVMGVDWESRVDFGRLRSQRLQRTREALEGSDLGALLLFDMNNIRYTTSTHIGTWARDKLFRCALVMRGRDPILWDIGSSARQHQMYAPWFPKDSWRAGLSSWRGAIPESVGVERANAERVAGILRDHGLAGEPLGIDVVELPVLRALEAQGLEVVNGQELMQQARRLKTIDEVALLDHACSMVDATYEDIYQVLRPGVRENQIVGRVTRNLFDMGSEEVEAVNSISGERCSPHPHVTSDRLLRPGDTAYFDIIHSFNGYHTCYYRTLNVGSSTPSQRDAYRRAREYMDAAIAVVRPGITTDVIAGQFPAAHEFGFASEEEAFGLQYAHGVGLSVWEQPLTSRYHSFEHPVPIEEGMVFAIETYWPTTDGAAAARIEEEVLVTATGTRVLTRFPSQDLLVAGTRYWTGLGPLGVQDPDGRALQPPRDVVDGVSVEALVAPGGDVADVRGEHHVGQ